MFKMADPDSYNQEQLTRELDKVKSKVFLADDAVFFGSLMCSLDFQWTRGMPTAGTDGVTMWFNPDFFMAMAVESRFTVLKHELWHVARLHTIRLGSRQPQEWNWACDIRINNDLENSKNSFIGIEDCWKDHKFDKMGSGPMAEEDIYDYIIKTGLKVPQTGSFGAGIPSDGVGGDCDIIPMTQQGKQQAINNVVQAVQQAKLAGNPGAIPGGTEIILKHFLDPVIPWQTLLMKFFTDLLNEDYTWKRPNRRIQHTYLPSRFTDDGRLEHLVYFLDVSGSISNEDILRFNSEVKYIQEMLCPERLTLVQFDTRIQDIKEFAVGDPFDEIKVIGRGGTSLHHVRKYIEEHRPTAAVVFSDMYVEDMEPLTVDVEIIWCVYNNPRATVPFGTMVHIK